MVEALGGENHAHTAEQTGKHHQAVGFLPDESERAERCERRDVRQPVENQIPIAERAFEAWRSGRSAHCDAASAL